MTLAAPLYLTPAAQSYLRRREPIRSTALARPVLIWFIRMGATTWHDVEQLVSEIEELQRRKVVDLARRLRPGLTPEDMRNPHDFPELADPDWQFEDGMLAGIQSVLSAMRARGRETEP